MSWFSHETAHFKIWDCCVLMPFLKDHCRIYLRLIVFPFADNFSKGQSQLISSPYRPVVFWKSSHLTIYRLFEHLWFPGSFEVCHKRPGGSRRKTEQRHLFPAILPPSMAKSCLLAVAERMEMWIGVFGGGRKEMLSLLNEGGFTQYNEGWTHGFTADVYLKRPGKYCFGTEGFICRYTYPLQPPAPTWGPELSLGSLLFFFLFFYFLSERVEKCETSSV